MVPQRFQCVRDVAKNGLQVVVCDITFERLKRDRSKTRKGDCLSCVPSGVATVAAPQTK
jgi:intracellular sulfur oxidation DsrE/DsrF family protein